jgi:Flp pilus assembly protein TadG
MLWEAEAIVKTARRQYGGESGSVVVLGSVTLFALLGVLMASADLGRVVMAQQRAQEVANLAALTAVESRPSQDYGRAFRRIAAAVEPDSSLDQPVTFVPRETIFYVGGNVVPGLGQLPARSEAVTAKTHVEVRLWYLGRLLGRQTASITRQATALRHANGSQQLVD